MVACLGRDIDLTRSMSLLGHRGIRSSVASARCGSLGHVRLPIVGLSRDNDQPIVRGRWIVGFVGEILDFRSYADEDVDTFLAVRNWVDGGPQGFRQHDGFWAIMALDTAAAELHILCDYLAQKPMYYRTDVPAAASELDALKPFGRVTPDEIYLSAVLKWGYCPDLERTPYREIKHVLPGEHVVLNEDGVLGRQIADPLTPLVVRGSQAPGRLRQAIESAVARRVTSSDVPVACLLSGGLDSSIVHAIASRHGDVRPFFAKMADPPKQGYLFESDGDGEESRAHQVAGKAQELRVVQVGEASRERSLEVMQEPIDLGSLVPQVALSDAIRQAFSPSGENRDGVVCLTGDGADEAFGGYRRAMDYDSQKSDVFQELPAWHLPRLDRVMMRNQIEVRSPFLAREVMALALGLEYRDRRGKDILRQVFRDVVPESVLQAPKIPLRTGAIARDRLANSQDLVSRFRTMNGWR